MDGTGENPTRRVEVLVVAGHDQDGKSENVTICRRGELDRPFEGVQDVARNRRVSVRCLRKNEGDQER